SLLVLRGVVLGVLADVAVLARGLDAFGDRVTAGDRELLQLRTEPGVRVYRQRRRRLLAGGARWTIAQLLGEFGHPPESSQQRLARCEGCVLRGRRVTRGEPDQERCPAAVPLLGPGLASVQLREPRHERESDPGAGSMRCGVHPSFEGAEDTF